MASAVVVLILTAVAFSVLVGGFLVISLRLRSDDHDLGSIRFEAPDRSARAVRALVGISASRFEEGLPDPPAH